MGSDTGAAPAGFLCAFQRAVGEFRLCPNRVWAVAKKKLPGLVPYSIKPILEHEKHKLCTFDFCEYSQRDFTAVEQRHECIERECGRMQHLFSRDTLEEAAINGKSTVWSLDGKSMIETPRPYMAISHVWSDGTGIGAWRDGEVNECLYTFFQIIARQFQCEGIWWDTLCIPRGKAARNKAIRNISSNYQDARITLVHDCFLRNWEWNEETACFAILMSPWFSRGWTAVELANSRKVKVIFRGPRGPLIKDLDEQILAKDGDPDGPRKEASNIIKNLRKKITTLNDLLTVLGPRHTSWPKDMAVISGLLAGVTPTEPQQDIYKRILRKVHPLSSGNLFHNAATMSKVSWCPTSLLNMPIADSDHASSDHIDSNRSLHIAKNWDLVGRWKVIPVDETVEKKCVWNCTHALMKEKAHEALTLPNKCVLLAEPGVEFTDKALLAKVMEKKGAFELPMQLHCQYVEALYFHPTMMKEYVDGKQATEMEVILLGDINGWTANSAENVWKVVQELAGARACAQATRLEGGETRKEGDICPNTGGIQGGVGPKHGRSDISPLILAASSGDEGTVADLLRLPIPVDSSEPVSQRTALHYAIWRGHHGVFHQLIDRMDLSAEDMLGQRPLHLAAERGDKDMVSSLLKSTLDAQCKYMQTALHRAAWGGSDAVVRLLLNKGSRADMKDKDGNIALHIAAEKGFEPVVDLLIRKSDVSEKGCKNLTPLHYAAMNGHTAVVRLLVTEGADINAKDEKIGWTPLHCAAMNGHTAAVQLLVNGNANINAKDEKIGWTPLHCAAMSGHAAVVQLLVNKDAVTDTEDKKGWTSRRLAAIKGHKEVVRQLPDRETNSSFNEMDNDRWTPLHCAAMNGEQGIVQLLDVSFETKDSKVIWTPLHYTAENGLMVVARLLVKLLVGEDARINAKDDLGGTPLHTSARYGHLAVAKLLIAEAGADNEEKDDDGWTPLHTAARYGSLAVVEWLIELKANKEARDNNGWTPLHLAAKYGDSAVAERLTEAEVNKEAKGKTGQTPLHLAAQHGKLDVAERLIKAGANKEAEDNRRRTPLHFAVKYGGLDVSELLVKAGANKEAEDDSRRTPLHLTALNNKLDVAKRLIKAGANKEARDGNGWTALHFAAKYGNPDVAEWLVKSKANKEAKDNNKSTPLHLAAQYGHLAVVKWLVEAGADKEANSSNGWTPLHLATEDSRSAVVKWLIEAGADKEAIDNGWNTPLHLAARGSRLDVAGLLVEAGADKEAINCGGETPLHISIYSNEDDDRLMPLYNTPRYNGLPVAELLVNAGANKEAEQGGINRWKPLHLAIEYKHVAAVEWLIKVGANKEAEGSNGRTPLHIAAREGGLACAKLLIKAGANKEAEDNRKRTPLHFAVKYGGLDVSELLVKAGANKEAEDYSRRTPLHLTAQFGRLGVSELLVKAGANKEAEDHNRRTPLHLAARFGHLAVVEWLIEARANKEARDNNRQTPLHLAAQYGYSDVVEWLIKEGADKEAEDNNGDTPTHLAAQYRDPDVVGWVE